MWPFQRTKECHHVSAIQEYERILAILREEISDLRRDRDSQLSRADSAADLLLQHLGMRAISLAGKAEEVERTERHARAVQTLSALPDPTEELPLGHPNGMFKSAADAAIFAGEDVGE